LNEPWYGITGKNCEAGLNLLKRIPQGSPLPLIPFHIPDDQLVDISKTFSWMKPEAVIYWKKFIADQVEHDNLFSHNPQRLFYCEIIILILINFFVVN
jgi:hypothetical protein